MQNAILHIITSPSFSLLSVTGCFMALAVITIIFSLSMSTQVAANSVATMKLFDVVVIGGGISGVLVSHGLQQQQQQQPRELRLLEARSVLGGRLANDVGGNKIDMGGAWVWPTHQPRIRKLLRQLDIPTFPQPDDPSSTRIDGGAVRIVERLAQDLPADQIQLNSPVKSCTLLPPHKAGHGESTSVVQIVTANQETFLARRVVFAVPPRLLHEHITFEPPLSPLKRQELAAAHTWMAGVTKIALQYSTRFWSGHSNMGLPSHLGPAFQVYDSSTVDNSVSALTFFALVDQDQEDETLAKQVANQMQQVWKYLGESAAADQVHTYTHHYVHRWPQQMYISEDPRPSRIHPHPEPERVLSEPEWDGLLHFAGSETDRLSPGVMEGAVGAAQRVLQALAEAWKTEITTCRDTAGK